MAERIQQDKYVYLCPYFVWKLSEGQTGHHVLYLHGVLWSGRCTWLPMRQRCPSIPWHQRTRQWTVGQSLDTWSLEDNSSAWSQHTGLVFASANTTWSRKQIQNRVKGRTCTVISQTIAAVVHRVVVLMGRKRCFGRLQKKCWYEETIPINYTISELPLGWSIIDTMNKHNIIHYIKPSIITWNNNVVISYD